MKASSPVWTIKGRYPQPRTDQTPSPHHYKIQKFGSTTTPEWKFGNQKKCQIAIDSNPGPGNYQAKGPQKSKTLGKFGRQNVNKFCKVIDQPGPGQYQPRANAVRKSSPVVSFGRQCKPVDKSYLIPGPGAYQRACAPHSGNQIVIGKTQRFSSKVYNNDVPGPGNYQLTRPNSAKTQTSFTRNTRTCTQIAHLGQPGPGQYQKTSIFQYSTSHHKGYSLGLKYQRKNQQILPGPAQYNPKIFDKKGNPCLTMGRRYKQHCPDKIPGPGEYSPKHQQKSPSIIMGKSKRLELNQSRQIPGPGTYNNMFLLSKSPKYSLGHSRKVQKTSEVPGPGTYTPDKNYIKKRPSSAKIGNQKRGFQTKQNIPGPGNYQSYRDDRPSTPKYSFGKNSRVHNYNTVSPGPGQYEVPSLLSNCPSYALR